jgi:diadenosine tetraphosphate (Ap4A) HIT family hydrolase
MKNFFVLAVIFCVGVLLGASLFSRTVEGTVLSPSLCNNDCFAKADIAALLFSAGIQLAPGAIPGKVVESARCIGIQHWRPEGRYHVAYFPKRDARNVMELQAEDMPYLLECLALAKAHVAKAGYSNYRLVSNGPKLQHVAYFHFHIIAK